MSYRSLLLPLLLYFCFSSGQGHAQMARSNRLPAVRQMTVIPRYTTPVELVQVFQDKARNQRRMVGKIAGQEADSLLFYSFYFSKTWKLVKGSTFSLAAPGQTVSIDGVYISKPIGPITEPSSQNLRQWDYAAICLSDGNVIYAEINATFMLNTTAKLPGAPGSGYLQFHELYDNGKFYQIKLTWDGGAKQWKYITDNYSTRPLGNGVRVLAVYSYTELTKTFYVRE